jgi:uncharacterized damage-inducible protein DinB
MKKISILTTAVAVIAAVSLLVSFRASEKKSFAAEKTQMVADWERAKAYTKEYLDASTDEVIASKPTPEMRSFGQQMLHISEANYGLVSGATGKKSPITWGQLEKSDSYKTKAELTKAVMESYDFAIAAIKEMDDSKAGETVKFFDKFEMSRSVALTKAFEHQTHHRGQTTVYLRLKGVTPPQEKLF